MDIVQSFYIGTSSEVCVVYFAVLITFFKSAQCTHSTEESPVRQHISKMGEPLLGSLICGSVALGMVLWNWHLMEGQKRRSRKAARDAAAAAGRARSRATPEASETESPRHRVRQDISSCDLVKLEPLVQGFASEAGQDPSPMFVKHSRDRAETLPISPPISSSSPRAAEMGFFRDEYTTIEPERNPSDNIVVEHVPVMAIDLDSLL